ncbi:MAG: hypothetical protein AABZ44_05850 [Elusimicrobiota bacterium]
MRSRIILSMIVALALIACQKKPWAVYDGRTDDVGSFTIEYPDNKVKAYTTGVGMGDTCFPTSMSISTKGDDGQLLFTLQASPSEEDFIECQRAWQGDMVTSKVGNVSAMSSTKTWGTVSFLNIPDQYVSVWMNESKDLSKLSHQIAATFKWLEPYDAAQSDTWGEHLKAALEKASRLPELPPNEDD